VEVKKFHTAKSLRKNATIHENILWKFLRAKRFNGLKVRRQHPIGPFIVDFYCSQKKLVIELDGGGHAEKEQAAYDKRRDRYLRKQGLQVLRIWNNELTENIDGVFETISNLCGLH
jgi:very-short-patch-repair endonuclease